MLSIIYTTKYSFIPLTTSCITFTLLFPLLFPIFISATFFFGLFQNEGANRTQPQRLSHPQVNLATLLILQTKGPTLEHNSSKLSTRVFHFPNNKLAPTMNTCTYSLSSVNDFCCSIICHSTSENKTNCYSARYAV